MFLLQGCQSRGRERDQHGDKGQHCGREDAEGGPHRQRHDRPRLGDGHDEDDRKTHQHHKLARSLHTG